MTKKPNIEMRDPASLTPYENNAKKHPEAQMRSLRASIKEFGFRQPVIVDEEGTILAGHARTTAAIEMGLAKIPVVVADGLSEAQKIGFVIADNKVSEAGKWDNEALYEEVQKLHGADLDLEALAIDPVAFGLEHNPVFANQETTEADMDAAQGKMDQKIDRLGEDKAENGIEVTCPHCLKDFRFHGH